MLFVPNNFPGWCQQPLNLAVIMKLLVLSGILSDYGNSLANAFQRLGYEVKCCEYLKPEKGVKGIWRRSILGRLGFYTEKKNIQKYFKEVLEIITKFRPEGIVVVTGQRRDFFSDVITSFIERVGKRPKLAIWYIDQLKYTPAKPLSRSFFDRWFVYEPTDVPIMKKEWGIEAIVLPMAFDPACYHPIDKNKAIPELIPDISFIGSVAYEKRKNILEHLSKNALENGLNFKIISDSFRFPLFYLKDQPNLRKVLEFGHADHKRNNMIYNISKINLNIHGPWAIEAMNTRFFEILGSCGLQIVERFKSQAQLGFCPDKDFLVYSGIGELREKVNFVLANPDKARVIAQSGHKKVKNHSWLSRAKIIQEQTFS
ncbi:MAG: glycosyltransferase [Nitrospinales bacterium]